MVELERAVVAWQQEGTPEAQGAVIWRAAQVIWETAALFKRHAGLDTAPSFFSGTINLVLCTLG